MKRLFLCLTLGAWWASNLYADLPWRETRQIEKGFTRHRVVDNPGNYKLINWGGRDYGTKSFMPYVQNPRHSHSLGRYGTPYYSTGRYTPYSSALACPIYSGPARPVEPQHQHIPQNVAQKEEKPQPQEKIDILTEHVEKLQEKIDSLTKRIEELEKEPEDNDDQAL